MTLPKYEYLKGWNVVIASYESHIRLLDEAFLHNKFVFKTCLVNPEIYADLMAEEQQFRHILSMEPQVNICGIPVKISTEIKDVSWIVNLEE